MQRKYGRSAKKNKLKLWLEEEDMSLKQFATLIGIDYFTARRYVANERAPVLLIAIIIEELTGGKVPCTSWWELAARHPAKKRTQKKNNGHEKKTPS